MQLNFLDIIPWYSFHWFGRIILGIFGMIGFICLGIAITLHDDSFHCYNKNISATREASLIKNIDLSYLSQYRNELNYDISNLLMVCLNFGIFITLSILFGYLVKNRVQDHARPITENYRNESDETLLATTSKKAPRLLTFYIYIAHLVIRFITLTTFVWLLFSKKIPNDYSCSWHPTLKETSWINHTAPASNNVIFLDCKNARSAKSKALIDVVAIIDVIFNFLTILEIIYLVYMACKDSFFKREKEFCVVYLIRKNKRIRKWSKQIKKQSRDYKTPNEFNDESTLKISDISVNVNIKAESLLEKAYPKTYIRHEILHYQLKPDEKEKEKKIDKSN